jgi:predicted transcriptional regulator
MSLFPECLSPQGGRAILLSIKPKYSDLILSGEKRVEFRRTWAAEEVNLIAIYASSPVQRIVAIVEVEDVIWGTSTVLWSHCVNRGGALTRRELVKYFDGKTRGCAILLGALRTLNKPIDPKSLFKAFAPPQSFRYLTSNELGKLERKTKADRVTT